MAEYIERSVGVSILRAKANMAVLMDAAPYFEKAAQMLEKLPAADVAEVRHGKWVEYPRAHYFKCSECKYTVPYRKAIFVNGNREYDYCPSCGARMDKEDEHEVSE